MSRRANYLGQRRGRLLIDKCLESSNGHNRMGKWLCICDCGNSVEVYGNNLYHKKSCGCLLMEHLYGGKSSRKYHITTINHQYNSHRSSTIRDGRIPLTKELWLVLVTQPCYYCGDMDVKNYASTKSYIKFHGKAILEDEIKLYEVKLNGVDRIDSSRGYELDNCVPCCKHCNTIKMDYTQDKFYQKVNIINTINNYRDVSLQSLLCN